MCAAFLACLRQFESTYPEDYVKKEADGLLKGPLYSMVGRFSSLVFYLLTEGAPRFKIRSESVY